VVNAITFADNALHTWAFVSSAFGNRHIAKSAHEAFQVEFEGADWRPTDEHSLVVNVFSDLSLRNMTRVTDTEKEALLYTHLHLKALLHRRDAASELPPWKFRDNDFEARIVLSREFPFAVKRIDNYKKRPAYESRPAGNADALRQSLQEDRSPTSTGTTGSLHGKLQQLDKESK